MKPAAFRYHRPETLDEALGLLSTLPDARVLAGGQSLMPMMNLRVAAFADLVDINRLPELAGIAIDDGAVRLGAMVRQRWLQHDPQVGRSLPLLVEALEQVGHVATRNRGTLGGSLCHLDPAAELPAVATAFDAEIEIASIRGLRTVPFAAFPAGLMTPAIEPDELVTAIRFVPWEQGHGWSFLEFARRPGDFAIVSAAAMIDAPGGIVRRARLVLGGLADHPVAVEAAGRLVGRVADEETLGDIAERCGRLPAAGNRQAPAWYRQRLAATLGARALAMAARRAAAHV